MTQSKLKGWKELPIGGIADEPGAAEAYHTGGWRTYKPIWHKENCILCYRCFLYCPDSSILREDGKVAGMDYDHCKGCGICAAVCPTKPEKRAIEMILEKK